MVFAHKPQEIALKGTSKNRQHLLFQRVGRWRGWNRQVAGWCWGILGGLWIGVSHAQTANEAGQCSDRMKRGAWKEAAACFSALVEAIPKNNTDPFLRRQKALYLQYAARSYAAYAKMQEGIPQRAYYYELAAAQLHRYLNEKLCDKLYQCRDARGLLQENESKIGYATLVFAGGDQPVRVEISGFETKIALVVEKQASQRLRPGSYQLQIAETAQAPHQKNLVLSPGQTQLVQVGRVAVAERKPPLLPTPPTNTSPPTGAYVLMAVGGGLVLVGVGMGIGSIVRGGQLAPLIEAEHVKLNRREIDPFNPTEIRRVDALVDEHDAMEVVNLAGWIGAGVGGALLLGGVIWFLAHPKTPATVKTASSSSHGIAAKTVILWRSSSEGRLF